MYSKIEFIHLQSRSVFSINHFLSSSAYSYQSFGEQSWELDNMRNDWDVFNNASFPHLPACSLLCIQFFKGCFLTWQIYITIFFGKMKFFGGVEEVWSLNSFPIYLLYMLKCQPALKHRDRFHIIISSYYFSKSQQIEHRM